MDGLVLGDDSLTGIGMATSLHTLSMVGCKGFTVAGIKSLAQACPRMASLEIGGRTIAIAAEGLMDFHSITSTFLVASLNLDIQPLHRIYGQAGRHRL